MKNLPDPESLKDSTSREKVLKRIRHALLEPSENPYPDLDFETPVHPLMEEEKDVQFAFELSRLGAKFIYCKSPSDMLTKVRALFAENKWTDACCNEELIAGLLQHAGISTYPGDNTPFNHISVTSCECMIARTGSIVVSSALDAGRRLPFTCDIHIVIAFTSQVVEDMKQAIDFMRQKYAGQLPSMISIISGTTRSDDIEKIMIPVGHGPKELYLFMADENSAD